MTIFLGDRFFRDIKSSPLHYEYNGRTLIVETVGQDRIQVRDGDVPVAHISRYSDSESGILPVNYPTNVLAPIFQTLIEALDSIELFNYSSLKKEE